MRLLIELNAGLFFASVAILYFVLRYRVHLHLEYRPRTSGRVRMRRNPNPRPVEAPVRSDAAWTAPAQTVKDLESALENLGATKTEARERARKAISQGQAGFDALLFRAMQGKQ